MKFNDEKLQAMLEVLNAREARFKQLKAEDPRDPSLMYGGTHFYHA